MKKFNSYIRAKRLELGLTQKQVAKAIGCSIPFYCDCELSQRNLRCNSKLKKLSRYFKTDVNWFYYLQGRYPPVLKQNIKTEIEFKEALKRFNKKK